MIKEEIKVIYMNLEEQIKDEISHYLLDNELNHFGGYSITVYGNEENNIFYYRYEVDTPEHSHFFSEWYSENYYGELKQFFTVDYLNDAVMNKDILITSYDDEDFNILQS
jgi:hypothetical protein